jgi:8-oxo-dGTP pyrophosphatase MutT (NUDIX family)
MRAPSAVRLRYLSGRISGGRALSRFTHAGGLVVCHDGERDGERVLLVKSRDGRHWVLPKGHIDPGETAAEAAVREVREESGVIAEIVSELGVDAYSLPHEEVRALYFLMRFSGEVSADEDRELCWLPVHEAAAAIEFEGSRALVEAYARSAAAG